MNKKTSGYRAPKATKTVRDKVGQVEEFSKYLMSPLKKRYDVFFRSNMVAFKAIWCWLKLKLSKKAPKNWAEKRKRIDDRITKLIRSPKREASIEEIPSEKGESINKNDNVPTVKNKERLAIEAREEDIEKVLRYNILQRGKDDHIQDWKSYPGLEKIIDMARDMTTTGNMRNIDILATMMQCHESQQSASIITTVAIIIGNKMNSKEINVDEKYRRAIGDIILWSTPVIKDEN